MLPKAEVNAVGARIKVVQKKAPKPRKPKVPDKAIDECQAMHVSGSGSNSKTNMEKFDDGGVMVLVCRHDIPLFLANIDTPGEQQKYAFALIERMMQLVPAETNLVVLYDVGCVIDRSCQLYDILPDQYASRISFTTNAMHAYVHQWSCQLVYNPRMQPGLGLTDGEGVERLWSRMRKLIGIMRTSYVSTPVPLSAYSLLTIHRSAHVASGYWTDKLAILEKSTRTIWDHGYNELRSIDYEFIRLLLMARDLKINIRKHAIGSFLEWDKLDQAVGGHEESLGANATRKAISKRKPALINTIRKFNGYCAQLTALYHEEWNIPIPEPLLLQLAPLREGALLLQDVWIMENPQDVAPLWLQDVGIRNGIRAMLKQDRCLEECRRLGVEADNLCQWFGRELQAVRAAMRRPSNSLLLTPLQQQYCYLLSFTERWSNQLASKLRFEAHVSAAEAIANPTGLDSTAPQLHWLTPQCNLSVDAGSSQAFVQVQFDSAEPLQTLDEEDNDEGDGRDGVDDAGIAGIHRADREPAPSELVDLYQGIDLMDGCDEEADELGSLAPSSSVKLVWTLPDLGALASPAAGHSTPTLSRCFQHGGTRFFFQASDLTIMTEPHQLLNDMCINGIGALLHRHFAQSTTPFFTANTALFSTFDLLMVQYDVNTTLRTPRCGDAHAKWSIGQSPSGFSPSIDRLFIGLAELQPWTVGVEVRLFFIVLSAASFELTLVGWQDIRRFAERLLALSNRKGLTSHPLEVSWEARLTQQVQACQTNGYDCGLWVLAAVAGFFHGAHGGVPVA
ncbi:hypothetical protein H0H92_001382 [Tricholoma furcatifolium]|nr:hypothetical protein H0H92_001382 [Tricholoma furcatifolium]